MGDRRCGVHSVRMKVGPVASAAFCFLLASAAAGPKAGEKQQASDALACPTTATVVADPGAEQLGEIRPHPDRWYVNSDRTIWAGADAPRLQSGNVEDVDNNILWIRPKGSTLTITVRRLDDPATATTTLPPSNSSFVVSKLSIRDAGCWEVTATAGESILKFVTLVRPPPAPVDLGDFIVR